LGDSMGRELYGRIVKIETVKGIVGVAIVFLILGMGKEKNHTRMGGVKRNPYTMMAFTILCLSCVACFPFS